MAGKLTAEGRAIADTACIRSRLRGAQGRNRTTDTVIFSHVLYQLSYLGAGLARTGRTAKRGVIEARIHTVQNASSEARA